jgi:hypothetical protein
VSQNQGVIADLGMRVELVPMDPHFFDISLSLYRQDGAEGVVHTYSQKPGADGRAAFVARAMSALGGVEGDGQRIRFPCGTWHAAAAKRLFLEACKLDSSATPEPRPLEVVDTKTGQQIRVEPLGGGAYRVHAEGAGEEAPSRAPAVAAGLAKLAELAVDDQTQVTFPCGEPHDELVGLLLVRALNVRAALREHEDTASRGILAAPSAQEQ